jgi:uncharacterized protein (TIGR03067 family)
MPVRRFALLTVVAAASVVAFAPAPLPSRDRLKEDPNALYGDWEFELWEWNGQKHAASQYLQLTQEKVHFITIQGGGKVTYDFIVRRELSPRGFQWVPTGGGGWIGSYRIQGDRLTLIFKSGNSWSDRPIDFDGRHEYRFILRKKR